MCIQCGWHSRKSMKANKNSCIGIAKGKKCNFNRIGRNDEEKIMKFTKVNLANRKAPTEIVHKAGKKCSFIHYLNGHCGMCSHRVKDLECGKKNHPLPTQMTVTEAKLHFAASIEICSAKLALFSTKPSTFILHHSFTAYDWNYVLPRQRYLWIRSAPGTIIQILNILQFINFFHNGMERIGDIEPKGNGLDWSFIGNLI